MKRISDYLGYHTMKSFEYMGIESRLFVAEWLIEHCGNKLDHPEDCERISDVMHDAEITISFQGAQTMWRDHSQANLAEWLTLPKSDTDLLEIMTDLWFGNEYD